MEINKVEFTNVYIPQHSLVFKFQNLSPKKISEKLISQIETTTCDQNHAPFGIIDFAKQSANYKSLIIAFGIDKYSDTEIYKMFSGLGEELFKQSWIKAELLNEEQSEETKNIDQNSHESELKSKVVYSNKVLGWSSKSQSSYFDQDEWRILGIIKEFEILQKTNERRIIETTGILNRKIKPQHVAAVKKFLFESKGKHITVEWIKIHLQENYSNLPMISDWSIRKILKSKLNYSYKKVCLIK